MDGRRSAQGLLRLQPPTRSDRKHGPQLGTTSSFTPCKKFNDDPADQEHCDPSNGQGVVEQGLPCQPIILVQANGGKRRAHYHHEPIEQITSAYCILDHIIHPFGDCTRLRGHDSNVYRYLNRIRFYQLNYPGTCVQVLQLTI